ncbi:sugar transferase [Qipengyuania sp. 6D47A]|uniref:Sugar transferase n=2 Tax=Qipengyuania qiaonensis TaxID=2867240 RepID=A0ABS7J8S2_9SPHN|nr:sugar transferase [Qipengyuania qiaonensis]
MKRPFDLFFAIFMIVATLPVMIMIALAIKIVAPGPVLFRQQRIGQDGLPFTCLKFRTMVVDAKERLAHLLENDPAAREEWEQDQKLRNDPRITRVGAMLRSSSLDELPQLFNILSGHMSVVGPRPIVADEVGRYGIDIRHYYAVRPGLTGLWQTSGRNDTSYEERVRLDVEYVRNVSFARDLSICLKTVPAMVLSRGCY